MAPLDLARRRAELERQLAAASERSPAEERLADLEGRIPAAEHRLARMESERTEILAERRPDGERLSRVDATQRLATEQLRRLEGERDDLTIEIAAQPPQRADLSRADRAELTLIEDRLVQLRRREVAAERAQPSKLIAETLGTRPKDPLKAALWNEGVDAIYAYRQRHGITSRTKDPLGPKPRNAAQRRDRRQAEVRLARVREALGKQRVRSAQRSMRILR
jgi:hypothetical protein